ncbi:MULTISPECIES: hypothetical protein [unclassified Arthrobacter]|uniref:hypothetical protein n=1 Tax=unclassified Arthrobacter TaxID=235627 RepID=UPI000AC23D8E|nr:hypothetical protein [Arthrobacter sp. Leaf141]
MRFFPYLVAIFLALAVGVVAFLDVPLWSKALAVVWIASPWVVNAFRLRQGKRIAAELASHCSSSVQDRILHDYRQRK